MLLLAACFALLLAAGQAGAATYEVDTATDNGALNTCAAGPGPADCSLRGALDKADNDTTADTVTFLGSLTSVNLDSPLLPITEKLTIDGNGTKVIGTGAYALTCPDLPAEYAFDLTGAPAALVRLPIYNVCSRPIKSIVPAPSIRIGPRRSNNTVSINGSGGGASVDIYRADPPAAASEAFEHFESAGATAGEYSSAPLATIPPPTEKFTATATDANGRTSAYSATASTPADLTSPALNNAVGVANDIVRLDFNESISGGITGVVAAFTLGMGTTNRQVTSVNVSGNSVYLGSSSTPWATGEAGQVTLNGSGFVTDVFGNEVIGLPSKTVYGGPGKLTVPVVSKFRTSPTKFCQRKTSKCRRGQTYLYITLSEDARVIFNVYRANGRKFVVRYVRKLPKGTSKTRLFGTINGRTLPAAQLLVNAVAEDTARNLSAPVDAPFKVVKRKAQL